MHDDNDRETGARVHKPRTGGDPSDDFSQRAAENKQPKDGIGLTDAQDDLEGNTRHSNGQNPPAATKRSREQ